MKKNAESSALTGPKNRYLAWLRHQPLLGGNRLEYLVAWYLMQGYAASTVLNKIREVHPELDGLLRPLKASSVLHLCKHAVELRIVKVVPPVRPKLAEQLGTAYGKISGITPRFYVVDESIGYRHSQSPPELFWDVAADAVADCLDEVVRLHPTGDINIGNTGGYSVCAASRRVVAWPVDPAFKDTVGRRLTFLSLCGAGSATGFNQHSNSISVQLGDSYGARHMACLSRHREFLGDDPSTEGDPEDYDRRVASMHMVISGIGTQNSYLRRWMARLGVKDESIAPLGKVKQSMIGDIFLNPINKDGEFLDFNNFAHGRLAPLLLRPTRAEALRLFGGQQLRVEHRTRSVVIVTEHRDALGKVRDPKTKVLHAVLSRGYISHCVLCSDLARLLVTDKLKAKPCEESPPGQED